MKRLIQKRITECGNIKKKLFLYSSFHYSDPACVNTLNSESVSNKDSFLVDKNLAQNQKGPLTVVIHEWRHTDLTQF